MRLSIIAAMGQNREIGQEGKIPWHLPDDIAMFRKLTSGHTVIMGRKTLEAIGGPLKNRTNIVVSVTLPSTEGITTARDLDEALSRVPSSETESFIIGGQQLYQEALTRANRIYLTSVDGIFRNADTFFPEFDSHDWEFKGSDTHPKDEQHNYAFVLRVFDRKKRESE